MGALGADPADAVEAAVEGAGGFAGDVFDPEAAAVSVAGAASLLFFMRMTGGFAGLGADVDASVAFSGLAFPVSSPPRLLLRVLPEEEAAGA